MGEKEINGALKLSKEINEAIDYLKCKMPYHLNVIDELHINENGHSRVLCKLLQFRNSKVNYEMLISLLDYINLRKKKEEFLNIKVENPEITQEVERIDLWVREKNSYAIIFENKIYNAADQDTQLSRYIQKTIEKGFNENQIFVIYLPSTDVCEPDANSWGNYKQSFENRYLKLSFREDIIPWLKEMVLPNIRNKDVTLNSAVCQYIDYLEGLFLQRKDYSKMDTEMFKLLDEKFEINDNMSDEEKRDLLQIKEEELQNTLSLISNYKNKIVIEINKSIKQRLEGKIKDDFPDYLYNDKNFGGIELAINGVLYILFIGYEQNKWYCQLQTENGSNININDSIISSIRMLLPSTDKQISIWRWCGNDSEEKSYNLMKEVVKKIEELQKKS